MFPCEYQTQEKRWLLVVLPSSTYPRTWYGYWKYSLFGQGKSPSCMFKECQKKRKRRRRKPVHSWEKLVCICILMVVFGLTYRDMQNTVPSLNLPWNNDEPYPDHTWIARTFKKIPLKYLEDILTRSASICVWKNQDLRKKKDYCCWLQIAPV